MSERCETCDCPMATEEDWKSIARALKAEAEVERLQRELTDSEVAREVLQQQREEARAEVEHWKGASKEHAEARAEVERLRASVENLDALYVSRTDALRECESEVERLNNAFLAGLAAGLAQGEEPDDA